MNSPSTPQYPTIQAANVVTGQDATTQAMGLANQYFAPQMGAQAQGIADINQGQSYYNNFGPTSLEQAVGNQYFSNVWPQEQSMIQNQFANSGMNFSPALASTEANAFGTLGTNVGEYLSNQSNTNATNNLSDLLNINPNNYYQPISNAITGQSNEQAQLTQQANMQNAQAQYMNSSAAYQQGLAQNGAIGTGIGTALGAVGGAFVGMPLQGAALGGSLGGAVMGGGSASGLGNAMQSMAYYGNQPGMGSTNGQNNSMFNQGVNQQLNNSYSNNASSGYGNNAPVQGGNMFGVAPLSSSANSGYPQ